MAACLAWTVNRYFYTHFGSKIVSNLVPVIEELLKTGLAYLFSTSILGTHGVFGIAEFVWDFSKPGKGHWLPALAALLSHLFYGFLTGLVFGLMNSLVGGVVVAALVHMAWNRLMLRLDS